MEVTEDLESIALEQPKTRLSSREILQGKTFDPVTQIKMYSPEEYEIFICEWTTTLKAKYARVFRSKGKGDKGRDVVCFYDSKPGGEWDNYQCKHYDHPLVPSDIWVEIGKVLYYTHKGDYTCPKAYYFVAPQGVANTAVDYLEDPALLKSGLKNNWDGCRTGITKKHTIHLEGGFLDYVDNFDFSIFSYIEPQTIINQHSATMWHPRRFGGGLKPRPKSSPPPVDINASELVYTSELIRAYGEREGSALALADVRNHSKHGDHFSRQRRYFYEAESLRQFAKDTLPNNGDFEDLQEQIHDGIVEILARDHKDGLERLDNVLSAAKNLQVAHVLSSDATPADKGGICHQLVNDQKIKWVKDGTD